MTQVSEIVSLERVSMRLKEKKTIVRIQIASMVDALQLG